MTPKEFIATLSEAAKASAKVTGVPASFTVAQAALESGWGRSLLARQGKNLFGVKADRAWTGETLAMSTREFLKGEWVQIQALWRRYTTWQDSLDDHGAFFRKNKRYAPCFTAKDAIDFAQQVQACGYATDPAYAEQIIKLIKQYDLLKLDA